SVWAAPHPDPLPASRGEGTGRRTAWRASSGAADVLANVLVGPVRVAEDVRLEDADLGVGVVPRGCGQAGLAAGRGQELLAVETVLDRDLRQQQAARGAAADVEPVAADLDLFRAVN